MTPSPRTSPLLAAFLAVLSLHGLGPEGLDPWRGWIAFKQFVRAEASGSDPGVSVQLVVDGPAAAVRLCFVRQAVDDRSADSTPIGAVVCEFTFAAPKRRPPRWELWSFDFGTLHRFVDAVEAAPAVADLMVSRPLRSRVYWEPAPLPPWSHERP